MHGECLGKLMRHSAAGDAGGFPRAGFPPRFNGYNGGMKKAGGLFIALVLLLPLQLCACGGSEGGSPDEGLALYAVQHLLIPSQRDSDFIVMWMRRSTGTGDVSPDELGLRFWKWEGGNLTGITLDEYEELAAMRIGGDPAAWVYGQHSVTVLEVDEDDGEAVVEIGSLYNPLAASGVRYLLRMEGGEWKKVSEMVVWGS
jgi:hypothetical protein